MRTKYDHILTIIEFTILILIIGFHIVFRLTDHEFTKHDNITVVYIIDDSIAPAINEVKEDE